MSTLVCLRLALGCGSGDAKLSPRRDAKADPANDAFPTDPPTQKHEEEEDDLYDDLYGGLTENTGDAKGDGKSRGSGDGDHKMGKVLEEGTAAAAGGKVGNEGVEGQGGNEVDGGMADDISTRAVMNSLKVMWRDITSLLCGRGGKAKTRSLPVYVCREAAIITRSMLKLRVSCRLRCAFYNSLYHIIFPGRIAIGSLVQRLEGPVFISVLPEDGASHVLETLPDELPHSADGFVRELLSVLAS